MPTYNKLIRDRIPEIIINNGNTCLTTTLNERGYQAELQKKLKEEVQEYLESVNHGEALEELADIMEVVQALSYVHNADPDKLETVRIGKALKYGGFEDKVFLVDVEDQD
ncbi:nucleoside triphosphate pyrophosphohydrolase [Tuberibacillus sp. Marseille-P3662]|uniref:nucleoside triphosphate pyrophosphohydrolase n=1 Tax=Tuberibacillus sp. Marseille-P3662 TaxID=1965358 RepID=UPI000A1CF301|nr:nucleoside triphosphate pyrophosphohydrolase [Tuberibacillus sp. Marseille-P3662]